MNKYCQFHYSGTLDWIGDGRQIGRIQKRVEFGWRVHVEPAATTSAVVRRPTITAQQPQHCHQLLATVCFFHHCLNVDSFDIVVTVWLLSLFYRLETHEDTNVPASYGMDRLMSCIHVCWWFNILFGTVCADPSSLPTSPVIGLLSPTPRTIVFCFEDCRIYIH